VKEERVGACSLACNSLWVESHAGVPRWGLRKVTSINYSHEPAQTKQQVG